MSGATFSRVKTWIAGESLTASDLNAEFDNILNNLDPAGIDDESANDAAAQATSDPYAGDSLVKATSLATEIQQLRYLIAQITGETYWYIDPDTTIAAINTKLTGGLDPADIDDESATDTAARATKDPYADGSLVKATSLQEEIQELRYLIAQITGETYWYIDPDNNIAAMESDINAIQADLIEAGTKMYFYQNTAPSGWTIDTTPADALLAVKGGSNAYNVDGGNQAGTWTQPNHTHTGPSHTHGTPFSFSTSYLRFNQNMISGTIDVTARISATGENAYGEPKLITEASGTGNTGGSATANTWRPLANVGIICTKD